MALEDLGAKAQKRQLGCRTPKVVVVPDEYSSWMGTESQPFSGQWFISAKWFNSWD
jgi:hypothetical protein